MTAQDMDLGFVVSKVKLHGMGALGDAKILLRFLLGKMAT